MSYSIREPILHPTPIANLRPTQITVGFREVAEKRERWRQEDKKRQESFLGGHMIPAIMGPRGRPYIIDHHHLARALFEEDVESVFITVVADLRALDEKTFWNVLDCRSWTHPYDAHGKRRAYSDVPKSVAELVDDPYRSLAGELRRNGGFAKDEAPFAEFLWADFLRLRLKRKAVESDFTAAVTKSMRLARSVDARYLPGWSGPDPE